MKKLILLPILFVLMISAAYAAYSNEINTRFIDDVTGLDLPNGSIYVYNCGLDSTCLNPTFWQSFNSGTGNTVTYTLPAVQTPTYYAHYFLMDGYVPIKMWSWENQSMQPAYWEVAFNKATNATALIDNFAVTSAFLGEPIRATFDATLSAETHSAFHEIQVPPFYDPHNDQPQLYDHYAALTNVTATVTNSTGDVVYTETRQYNILMDTSVFVDFQYNPQDVGEYTWQISTLVVDDQVDVSTSIPQSAARVATVIPAAGEVNYTYAELSNLTWTPDNIGVGQRVDFTAYKVANAIDQNNAKFTVPMTAYINITGPDNNFTSFVVPANDPNGGDVYAEPFTFDWTPTVPGDYIINVTGVPDGSAYAWSTQTIIDTLLNTFRVEGSAVNLAPSISNTVPGSPFVQDPALFQSYEFTATDPEGQDMTAYIYADDVLDQTVTVQSGVAYTSWGIAWGTSGNHNVTVIVTDGLSSAEYTWDVIVNSPPHIFSYNPSNFDIEIGRKTIVGFQAGVEDAEESTLNITWNITDVAAGTSVYTEQVEVPNNTYHDIEYQFNNSGEFQVEVEVTDGYSRVSETWNVNVSQCVVPWNYMYIDEDMTFCTGTYDIDSMKITENNVDLDGNGSVFNGNDSWVLIAIANNLQNITITNMTINDAAYAIDVQDVDNLDISEITTYNHTDVAMWFYNVSDLDMWNVTVNSELADAEGIGLNNVSNSVLRNIKVDVEDDAFGIIASDHVLFDGLDLDSPQEGLIIDYSDMLMFDNVDVYAEDSAIVMWDTTNVLFDDTVVNGTDYGVYGINSTFTFQDSNFIDTLQEHFEIWDSTNGTLVNTRFDNTSAYIDSSSKLEILWYIDIHVNDALGNNVNGALVELFDNTGAEVWNSTTDAAGMIPQHTYMEYRLEESGRTDFTDHTINVTATGYEPYTEVRTLSGNIGTIQITLTPSSNLPPTITGTQPTTPVNLFTGDTQDFNATVTDPEGNNLAVEWLLDSVQAQYTASFVSGNEDSYSNTFATAGTYNVTVNVTDDQGLTAQHEWSVVVTDPEAPTITATQPATPVNLDTGDSQEFNFTINDPEGNNLDMNFTITDPSAVNVVENTYNGVASGSSYNITHTFNYAGTWTVTVDVEDDQGLTAQYVWTVYVDTPIATTGNIVINEINYNPNLDNSYNEWIEIYNNESFSIDLSGWTLCGDALQGGYINHTDGVTYLDNPRILSANSYAVITDGGSGTDVYENYNVDAGALALHVDAASLCGGLENGGETIELNDSTNTYTTSVTYSDTWGADGNGRTLEKIDSALDDNTAANWQESYVDFGTPGGLNSLVPNQYPTITLTEPVTPYSVNVDDNVTFNATFTDAEAGVMTVEWYVDGGLNRTDSGVATGSFRTFDYNFTVAKQYNITVVVIDDDSNTASYSWNVTASIPGVDSLPVVTLTSPLGTIIRTYDGYVLFEYTASDDNQVDNCTLYTDMSGMWADYTTDSLAPFDNFTLTGISDGSYNWNVLCTDNASQSAYAAANGTFTVDRVGMVEGYVKDESDTGIPSANVEIKLGAVTLNATTTDALGYYSAWVDAGTYDVLAFAAGYNQNLTTGVTVTDGNTTEVNATLVQPVTTGNLSGNVNDGTNNIYNAQVQLSLGASIIQTTSTDENGNYSLTGVLPGSYTLNVIKPGFDDYLNVITIVADSETVEDATLTPAAFAGRILGVVQASGVGIPNARVTLRAYGDLRQVVYSDASGVYAINGVVPTVGFTYELDVEPIPAPYTISLGQSGLNVMPGEIVTNQKILLLV